MTHHLDIYREEKPATLPRALKWPLFVVAFPVVLVTAIAWLPMILLWRREPPVNTTPCGSLCRHAKWFKPPSGNVTPARGWRCDASQGFRCGDARPIFTTKRDPNNCTMFVRKEP